MSKDQKIIKVKVGLLELAKQLGNVSQACKVMGYRRDSFHRFKQLYDRTGSSLRRAITSIPHSQKALTPHSSPYLRLTRIAAPGRFQSPSGRL